MQAIDIMPRSHCAAKDPTKADIFIRPDVGDFSAIPVGQSARADPAWPATLPGRRFAPD